MNDNVGKQMKLATISLGITAFWLTVTTENVHAYIDPATGSYVFQMLLAGLLGALFALKIFWRNIKAFFSRIFNRKTD